MKYEIGLGAWGSVFAVPREVCGPLLENATALQIKALLLLLSSGGTSLEELARQLGCTQSEIAPALDYWVDGGLLTRSGGRFGPAGPTPAAAGAPRDAQRRAEAAAVPAPADTMPVITSAEAAQRLQSSDDLRFLIELASNRLGKLLTQNEISQLISILDYTGLPVDIMTMLVEYSVQTGKKGFSYIKKMALDWSERGITGHEAADAEIRRLLAREEAGSEIRRLFGLTGRSLSAAESQYAACWHEELSLPYDLIAEAYERCVLQTGKCDFRYIDKVLKNWHAQNLTTLAQVKEGTPAAKKGKKAGESEKVLAPANDDDFYKNAFRKRSLKKDE